MVLYGPQIEVYGTNEWKRIQDLTWQRWYATSASTTTATYTSYFQGNQVWNGWIEANEATRLVTYTYATPIQQHVWDRWEVIHRETEEEARRREQRDAEYAAELQRRADERQALREEESRRRLALMEKKAVAEARAGELLELLLTPEEKEYRARHHEIMVRGNAGGMYIIELHESVHGNVKHIDEHGCLLGRICVQPAMSEYDEAGRHHALPLADGWVGQYLAIKFQEEVMRTTGNWSHRRVCQHQNVPVLPREILAA